MADRWRSTQVVAWTERDGPGRPPKGPNRALGFGLSATLGAVFAGMVISDSLCPEHRMWVQGLATLGFACIVGAAIGLAKGWSYAPVLAVLAGFAGVAIGAVDTVHDPARGQLIVLVMGAAALAASALALRQITLAKWDRHVRQQLVDDPTRLPADGDVIAPTTDRDEVVASVPSPT